MPVMRRPSLLVFMMTACAPATPPASQAPSAAPAPLASAPASPEPSVSAAPPAELPPSEPPPSEPVKFDLVVVFSSFGTGTDHEAGMRIRAVAERTSKRTGLAIEPKVESWGREGERDDCYDLGKLSEADKERFIREVIQAAGDSERVTMFRDEPCRR